MKASELFLAAVAHVVGLAVTLLVVAKMQVGDPGVAWVVAAILGTMIGAFSYHRRHPDKASPAEKATLGAVLAVLSVVGAFVVLSFWQFTPFPDVVIPITAVGSFGFPFVLFGTAQSSLEKARAAKREPGKE